MVTATAPMPPELSRAMRPPASRTRRRVHFTVWASHPPPTCSSSESLTTPPVRSVRPPVMKTWPVTPFGTAPVLDPTVGATTFKENMTPTVPNLTNWCATPIPALPDQPYLLNFRRQRRAGIANPRQPGRCQECDRDRHLGNVSERCHRPMALRRWPGHMCDFSTSGPCADGRIKPDLVAPGSCDRFGRIFSRAGRGCDCVDGD